MGGTECLEGLGAVAWMRRDVERAVRLYAAASLCGGRRVPSGPA